MVLRAIYNRGRITGSDLSGELKLPYQVLAPVLPLMRKQGLIDIVGQKGGGGDATFEYEIKPPKGSLALQDALDKTTYSGPAPVPFDDYVESVIAQMIKNDLPFGRFGRADEVGSVVAFRAVGYPTRRRQSLPDRHPGHRRSVEAESTACSTSMPDTAAATTPVPTCSHRRHRTASRS